MSSDPTITLDAVSQSSTGVAAFDASDAAVAAQMGEGQTLFGMILGTFPCITALFIAFCCVCIVCEQRLVPAVEVFIKEYAIPEELAAVTLIAFGSASPELLLNTVNT